MIQTKYHLKLKAVDDPLCSQHQQTLQQTLTEFDFPRAREVNVYPKFVQEAKSIDLTWMRQLSRLVDVAASDQHKMRKKLMP